MNENRMPNSERKTSVIFSECKGAECSIRLVFSEEQNLEAPALIRELLRNSYFNRISSESRCQR